MEYSFPKYLLSKQSVDDRALNLECAAEAGMDGVLFTGVDDLRRWFENDMRFLAQFGRGGAAPTRPGVGSTPATQKGGEG